MKEWGKPDTQHVQPRYPGLKSGDAFCVRTCDVMFILEIGTIQLHADPDMSLLIVLKSLIINALF